LGGFQNLMTKVTHEPGARLTAIDVLRGLDVWLMLFVNEMAGVAGTPAFLRHFHPRDGDGMTITDIVFPAFLFIVGLAVPFAVGGRLRRGEPVAVVARHVVLRTLGLLVIGVFMVNAEGSPGLRAAAWNVAMTIAVILVWQRVANERVRRGLRLAGIALLVALVFAYRNAAVGGVVQMRPQWWGILGLIGWAYLVAALLYLVARDRPAPLVGAVALLYVLDLADEVGTVPWLEAVQPYLNVGRVLAAHGAIVVSGMVLGILALRAETTGRARLVRDALLYALALGACGVWLHALAPLHRMFWLNKIWATPPWCLISSAWTCAAFALVYWIADVRGFRRWPASIGIAGENALVAYLLAPLLLSTFTLLSPLIGDPYGTLGETPVVGAIRSLVFAWVVIRLCGLLRARGIRVQL
jgi:heparan-alpha-glucosaminide N-acetyltransferase